MTRFLRAGLRSLDKMRLTKILLIVLMITATTHAAYAVISKEQAEQAIVQAERNIAEMQASGLSTVFVNSTLETARMVLKGQKVSETFESLGSVCEAYTRASERAYCQSNLNTLQKLAEKGNVTEVNLETYDRVVELTDRIAERKMQAFDAVDKIRSVEFNIVDYRSSGVDVGGVAEILNESKLAMTEERYDEALTLISQAEAELENRRAELTLGRIILEGSKNFFQRNQRAILTLFMILIVASAVGQYPLRIYLLKRRIFKFNVETKALHKLIKEAQIAKFRKGSIPDSVYTIRMDVYKKKLDYVKENLPLYEAKLKRLNMFWQKFGKR